MGSHDSRSVSICDNQLQKPAVQKLPREANANSAKHIFQGRQITRLSITELGQDDQPGQIGGVDTFRVDTHNLHDGYSLCDDIFSLSTR